MASNFLQQIDLLMSKVTPELREDFSKVNTVWVRKHLPKVKDPIRIVNLAMAVRRSLNQVPRR